MAFNLHLPLSLRQQSLLISDSGFARQSGLQQSTASLRSEPAPFAALIGLQKQRPERLAAVAAPDSTSAAAEPAGTLLLLAALPAGVR